LVTRLISLALATALVAGCSDDNGAADKGVPDQALVDSTVDGEPTPDGPISDGPMFDQPVSPDAGPDLPALEAGVDLPLGETGPDGPVTPTNDTCSSPEVLTLVSGTVTKSSDTSAATNEFGTDVDCGESSFGGPQLYYKLSLTGGLTYKVTMTPAGWDGALYAFPASTSCGGTDIDTACTGHASDKIGTLVETILLKPTANEDWLIVVDAYSSTVSGLFTLKIEEVVAPTNDKCSTPKPLTFTGTSITETGDTTLALPEYGGNVDCGSGYGMDANQLYYKVPLAAGKLYKAALSPDSSWDGALYAFVATTTCDSAAIDTACTGYFSDAYGNGKDDVIVVAPAQNEDWIFVVDSDYTSDSGPFTLKIEELAIAANAACTSAQAVTFVSDKASITADTTTGPNEFGTQINCGGATDYDGNQLYYKVNVPAGKVLRMSLSSQFSAYLIVFKGSSCSSVASINTDCGSGGATGDLQGSVSSGSTGNYYFNPAAAGDYIVAVDGSSVGALGTFKLDLELMTPPTNDTCNQAQVVSTLPAKVSSTTALSSNQFGININCGGSTNFDEAQLYYKVTIPAGKGLKLTYAPDFYSYLYIFPDSANCVEGDINTACGSSGATGLYEYVPSGSVKAIYFIPGTAGDYIIVADGSSYSGDFTLDIEEYTPPTNGTCAAAAAETLTNGSLLLAGSTVGTTDELATLKCGGTTDFDGPQVYHKLSLTGGKKYRISVASTFASQVYLFPASAGCTQTAIETACASAGTSGATAAVPVNEVYDMMFTPSATADYLVGIDSADAADVGTYYLFIQEHSVPTFTAPFTFDFDGDCKGLAGTQDWQCGTLSFKPSSRCEAAAVGPTAAHSGAGAWGTVLNDCYSEIGNNQESNCTSTFTSDDSVLAFKVTIPASWTTATMTYWSWEDLWISYDFGEIRINGTGITAGQICSGAYVAPTAWVQRSVDLSAHVGQTVDVAFHMMASTVVNYAGWYIDDLAISGS